MVRAVIHQQSLMFTNCAARQSLCLLKLPLYQLLVKDSLLQAAEQQQDSCVSFAGDQKLSQKSIARSSPEVFCVLTCGMHS